jgi:hypothetical protein
VVEKARRAQQAGAIAVYTEGDPARSRLADGIDIAVFLMNVFIPFALQPSTLIVPRPYRSYYADATQSKASQVQQTPCFPHFHHLLC